MLFTPYTLNSALTLSNRLVMAPLTRCFADDNLVPTASMARYYERRADAGLIITEATLIRPDAQGYPKTPGIYTPEQVAGWQAITAAVHEHGGKIFNQIWHTGRIAHSHFSGLPPVAPSAVAYDGSVPRMRELKYERPQALSQSEIQTLISDYVHAARNAMAAGFNGVEIHGANGYLIDQFLHQATNQREDDYGGSVENRARFALEVVQAVIDAIGHEHVAIRLSPAAYLHLEYVDGDEDTFVYLLEQLSDLQLAYVHVGMFNDSKAVDYLDGRVSEFIRRHYRGTLIGSGSYSAESALQDLEADKVDLVAFGRLFIANPDLVEKLRNNASNNSSNNPSNNAELTPYSDELLGRLE